MLHFLLLAILDMVQAEVLPISLVEQKAMEKTRLTIIHKDDK